MGPEDEARQIAEALPSGEAPRFLLRDRDGIYGHDSQDHVVVLNEARLRAILDEYFTHYHEARAHLSLDRNSPMPPTVEPPESGCVVAGPLLGRLRQSLSPRRVGYDLGNSTTPAERVAMRCCAPWALLTRYLRRPAGHLSNIASSLVMPLDKIDYHDKQFLDQLDADERA